MSYRRGWANRDLTENKVKGVSSVFGNMHFLFFIFPLL